MYIHFYGLKYYDYTSHFKLKWILKNRRYQRGKRKIGIMDEPAVPGLSVYLFSGNTNLKLCLTQRL
jgi:hypothetical protein